MILDSITSDFSTPDGKRQGPDSIGATLATSRRVELVGAWTVVFERLHNVTAAPLPVLTRHSLKAVGETRVCGRIAPQWADPANPTLFTNGIGLIALDDAFRVHVNAFTDGKSAYLCDLSRVIPAGGTQVMRWACRKADSYWEFADAARSLLGGVLPLPGPPAWLRLDHGGDDGAIIKHAALTRCAYLVLPPTKVNGVDAHGTALARQPLAAIGTELARWKWLLPSVKHLAYFDFGFLGTEADAAEFPESVQRGADGKALYAQLQGGKLPMMFAQAGSRYAARLRETVDALLDTAPDGIYIDLSECGGPTYHYGEPWDQVSGDVDYTTGKLLGLKSSVALLTQDYRVGLVRELLNAGIAVVCNMAPWTQDSTALGVPRFVEATRPEHFPSAHLYTPQAYLGGSATTQDEADAQAHEALAHGCLPVDPWDLGIVRTRRTVGAGCYPAIQGTVRPT